MSAGNKIAKNVIANYVGVFGQIAIAFFLSPFLVNTLGDTKYGIWTIVAALSGYMSLLDLGISSAIGRYVSKYHQSSDHQKLNAIVNSALLLFLLISTLVVLISPWTSRFIVNFVNFDAELESTVQLLVVIVSFDVAIFVISGIFRGAFVGFQRYEVINFAIITSSIYKAILFYVFLSNEYGLLTMGLISISANLLTASAYFLVLKRSYKFLTITPVKANRKATLDIWSFGKFTFIGMLANQVIYYSDAFVIGYFLSAAAVTYYTIPWSLMEYTMRLCLGISRTFVPAFSAQEELNDTSQIYKLYISGTKYMLIVSNLLCVGIMVFGGDFIAIWMGERFREICAPLVLILFTTLLIQAPQLISYSLLLGLAKHKTYSYVSIGVSVCNLVLSIVLVQQYGLIGVAIGSAVPQILFHGVFVPYYTNKALGFSIWAYYLKTYLSVLLPTLILFVALFTLKSFYAPTGFLILLAEAALAAIIFIISAYFLTLSREEKNSALALISTIKTKVLKK